MSTITIRIPTPLRPFVGDAATLDADADTVGEALERVGADHPGFLQRLLDLQLGGRVGQGQVGDVHVRR